MITVKDLLRRTYQNLYILQEREAKFAGNAPLELLNQISDHQTAIQLIEAALAIDMTADDLVDLKADLRRLLIASNVEQIDLEAVKLEKKPLPYEPETVFIPAGPFLLGSDDHQPEEAPQHEVRLRAYKIGKYPVTNKEYAEFIKQNPQQPIPRKVGWFVRQPPPTKLDHPVVGVSWHETLAYCRWLSQQTGRSYRLPTEAEWEKAASWTGDEKRIYPWGNSFEAERCNSAEDDLDDTVRVGHFSPAGDSFYGCADMAGNVQEWTSTLWGSDLKQNSFPYPYRADDGREDLAAEVRLHRTYRIHRGGAFRDDARRLHCSARGYSDPDSRIRWRGFRVVLAL